MTLGPISSSSGAMANVFPTVSCCKNELVIDPTPIINIMKAEMAVKKGKIPSKDHCMHCRKKDNELG